MRKRIAVTLPNGGVRMDFADKKKKRKVETASVEPVETAMIESAEPKHVGGGWYDLPDGRRVRKSEIEAGD